MTATLLFAGGGTGGHVYPMIAVADAVRSLAPELRLVFVGTERGLETRIVPQRGYELELVKVGQIPARERLVDRLGQPGERVRGAHDEDPPRRRREPLAEPPNKINANLKPRPRHPRRTLRQRF